MWSCQIHVAVEVGLHEIPSNLGFNSIVFYSFTMEVNPFHVIFDLNGNMIATSFNKGSCTIILCPRLKEFLENVLLNSRCVFGLQPNVIISIINWIKFGTKQK
jgi:hypothetical protein